MIIGCRVPACRFPPPSRAVSRLIAFEADGEVRDPLAGDAIYQVTGQWEDAVGTIYGEGFPGCLAGTKVDPVSTS